ncbi:RagB/SusD family nutrient uptake outer membrane protein [Chryseobacterium lactis]|uniref:RagB/SusD family nutrient uptake outer membrane protein n=1 Tax=Chryseobacterium lactis TaxID=1241981 RepID=A0A3G6RRD6_CHRLC|nr:RagB/SusD family nutrient uptake outer membrane protein [Chryseobacterium lactis]AZA83645.1 RagB/SusD family nutrient uptake outer membrane protein [Chryseobacterium lactis]AZB04030.1 RagB/SusD family nutrient uptake outer membrane protein [Chryseobacterium lactis]PNW13061.1 RagB/SusD family nutrient uptake outer membrane protein [Chryseobacterium lactis]
MKKLYIPLLSIFLWQSCSSDLLNTSPESIKQTDNFYKDEAQLEQGVNAVYGSLQYVGQYQLAMLAIGEIPSDNTYDEVPANDSFTYGELDFFTVQPNNSLLASTWKENYIGIQQANIVLNRIGNVSMSQSQKNIRTGEVKFLRALMYFNMVRIFGDIPLVTKESVNVNEYFGQGRTPAETVYTFIESELKDAITLLPETTAQKGRVTKGAALGMLGKVLVTRNKYSEALPYLKQVEGLNYSLLTDVTKIFDVTNKNNAEIIFDVQFTSGLNGNTEGSQAYQMFSPSGFSAGAKGHNLPTKEVYNTFAATDKRRDAYIGLTTNGVPYSKKLTKPTTAPADGGSNVVVLRLAEVYLLMAECYAKTNDPVNGNLYLNKIKNRAGLTSVTIADSTDLLDEIALERRKELIGEGHRWFDLVRTGKAIQVMTAHFQNTPGYGTAQIQPYNLLMPVPQNQINTDPAIKQNPGY